MQHILPPNQHDLGGLVVNRLLPRAQRRHVGPFVFWDHIGPAPLVRGDELSVRAHPHIGLSTLTYLFEGQILHRDSLGNETVIRPGAVNWMTAGRGIAHSERTGPVAGTGGNLHGIQVWVALPKASEECAPSFTHIPAHELPETRPAPGVHLRLIAGEGWGLRSPVPVFSPLFYAELKMEAGALVEIPLEGKELGVEMIRGSAFCGGDRLTPESLWACDNEQSVTLRAETEVHAVVFGGEAFPEPRYIFWNFVSSSKDRIEQAKQDWREGRFAPVFHETERAPLPGEEP